MSDKSSHEGMKLGAACSHLNQMNAEYGRAKSAGNKSVPESAQPTATAQMAAKPMRRPGC